MRAPENLTHAVTHLANTVKREGGRALVVGGAVRDMLRKKVVTDMDVEVYGIPAQRLQELLEQQFHGRVYLVGASFGVFKIPLDDDLFLDVSLPRRESKTGRGHKGFTVEGDPTLSIEDAARRRDFTVNSILMDPLTKEIIDPYNGIKDLEQHVLRVTDPQTFGDDPLRVYRALQFAARFELTPTSETLDLLKQMVSRGDCDELPKERITEELRKLLLKAKKPSIGFTLAENIGLIARDYPELAMDGDTWTRTLLVLDRAAQRIQQLTENEQLQVMIGCLCHDLGKSATKSLLARWRFGEDIKRAAITIATEHLKPEALFRALQEQKMTDDQYKNAIRKLIRRIHPVSWRVLITAAEANDLTAEASAHFLKTLNAANLEHGLPRPLLQGRDLLELGVAPGPTMGRLIRAIEDARDKGDIKTKKEAVKMAKTMLD